MAKDLPPFPKCSKCGAFIITGRADICPKCELQEVRESYEKVTDAERKLMYDKVKFQKFSGYSVFTFIFILMLLIAALAAVILIR